MIPGRKKASQTKATTVKKRPVRRKRAAPGLLYDDVDNTQPSQLTRKRPSHPEDDLSSDDSGFDIGAKVSPAKVKVTPKKRRGGILCSGRTQPQSVVSPTQFDRTRETAVPKSKVSWKVPNSVSEIPDYGLGSDAPEDVVGLLQELGTKAANTEHCQRDQKQPAAAKPVTLQGQKRGGAELPKEGDIGSSADGKAKLSVLDDIFSDPEECQLKKRRPPPRRGQTLKTKSSAGIKRKDSTVDPLGVPSTSRLRSVGRLSASSSSEVFSDLMNNSTLIDDDVDCFGEPGQWKKRQKKHKAPTKRIDRLLQETTDDYLKLFESGRLVKKREREKSTGQKGDREGLAEREKQASRTEVNRLESSEVDPSGSLF